MFSVAFAILCVLSLGQALEKDKKMEGRCKKWKNQKK